MAFQPVITFPTPAPGFSTNLLYQTLAGTADPSTASILVNGSSQNVSYASGSTGWSYTTTLNPGENTFQVMAVDSSHNLSAAATISITYTSAENLNLIVTAPTGITLERGKNTVKVSVIENPEPEVIGYNFYGSEDVGGGVNGFTLLNSSLVTIPDTYVPVSVVLSTTTTSSGDIVTTSTIEQVKKNYYYAYTHDRTKQSLGTKPISEVNQYVVTAVAFDPILQQQVESNYSAELGAAPILIDTSVKDLPLRQTIDIQQTYIEDVLKVNPNIDVKPGTITRDVHINPPSDEFERLYIIQDFMHRSQSFLTLLAFDDPYNTGISAPVLTTPNKLRLKEALLISDENAAQVQTLIDDAFTKLAGNVNYTRKQAQKAIGQALFYTKRVPTKNATINAGGIIQTVSDSSNPAIQFTVLTDFTLNITQLSNYYNAALNRYEVTLDIQAINPGEAGNVSAGLITLVSSGIDSVFAVTNPNPTQFGQDLESNNSLAQRAVLAFVSVDSGTAAGYLATTLGTPYVQRAQIITAGDPLMQRDLDSLRLTHTFGKVDIYVQGSVSATYTDNFGFSYNSAKNAPTLIISANDYSFSVINPDVTPEKPIFNIVQVINTTKAVTYDVTGAVIFGNGESFKLDGTLPANAATPVSPTDTILVTYFWRNSNPYVFKNQPVDNIISVEGENSGFLTGTNYLLEKKQDPLVYGNSTSSEDQMSMIYANGVPNGGLVTVTDEDQLLLGENYNSLSRYGIDATTIVVKDSTGTITYTPNLDYTIIPGDMTTLTQIARTVSSAIPNGSTVLVSYVAGENFTVTYAANTLLNNVQSKIDKMKHLTADVIVKGAVLTKVDFDIDVVLSYGADQSSVDVQIRTAIAKVFVSKNLGSSIYQSDIVRAIENTTGVDHVLIPFNKMVKANGSYCIREVYEGGWNVHQTGVVTSYVSTNTLSWPTVDGGGPANAYRGLYENDIELNLVDTIEEVAQAAGNAFISSSGHLYVSPRKGSDITVKTITTTYLVENATGARDIYFSAIEYGQVGTLALTFTYATQPQGF